MKMKIVSFTNLFDLQGEDWWTFYDLLISYLETLFITHKSIFAKVH